MLDCAEQPGSWAALGSSLWNPGLTASFPTGKGAPSGARGQSYGGADMPKVHPKPHDSRAPGVGIGKRRPGDHAN